MDCVAVVPSASTALTAIGFAPSCSGTWLTTNRFSVKEANIPLTVTPISWLAVLVTVPVTITLMPVMEAPSTGDVIVMPICAFVLNVLSADTAAAPLAALDETRK
ncbi:MAG: hypothetical protein A4E68_01570 [Syntrophaceae bacterium PtaB.Bin095]|nr:MAG: hypothetical protein A4E68_01570 [Syntrophaceae bacterium PtaB.Bin095]